MTEKLLSPLRTRPWPERWLTRALGAALATAAYALCVPSGAVPASDEAHGGAGAVLAVILVVLAGYFGHRDDLAWPLLVVAVGPAVLMYLSFEAERPLAWASATLVIAAGTLVVAGVGRWFRPREEDSNDGLLCAAGHRS
ncbi:hypothetical protein [Streptomyces sp. NPDC096013]|uniref:hypothetical protein n=1 Tax=Streptomyces sp. NPDC096013 TaxID=3366069 RepID=UPI0038229425